MILSFLILSICSNKHYSIYIYNLISEEVNMEVNIERLCEVSAKNTIWRLRSIKLDGIKIRVYECKNHPYQMVSAGYVRGCTRIVRKKNNRNSVNYAPESEEYDPGRHNETIGQALNEFRESERTRAVARFYGVD